MKTLILDYEKLIDRTMVPIANTIITNVDNSQNVAENDLDRATNRMEVIEGAGVRMGKRTHAQSLLSRFKA
jgi:hypothetical protein